MPWGEEGGGEGGGVLQQQMGFISDIKQSHISEREQTELPVSPHLHLSARELAEYFMAVMGEGGGW